MLYNPSVLTAEYLTSDDADEEIRELKITSIDNYAEVITAAVQEVIARLPFNGEYRNSDLMAAVQAVKGVEVADIAVVEVCANGSENYTPVVG